MSCFDVPKCFKLSPASTLTQVNHLSNMLFDDSIFLERYSESL